MSVAGHVTLPSHSLRSNTVKPVSNGTWTLRKPVFSGEIYIPDE